MAKIGKSGCEVACGNVLQAGDLLVELVGDLGSGGDKIGNWNDKSKAERAKRLAEVLRHLSVATSILTEALVGQLPD